MSRPFLTGKCILYCWKWSKSSVKNAPVCTVGSTVKTLTDFDHCSYFPHKFSYSRRVNHWKNIYISIYFVKLFFSPQRWRNEVHDGSRLDRSVWCDCHTGQEASLLPWYNQVGLLPVTKAIFISARETPEIFVIVWDIFLLLLRQSITPNLWQPCGSNLADMSPWLLVISALEDKGHGVWNML